MKIHRQESAEGYRLHYDCDKGCFWDAAQDSCGWKVDQAQVERALNAMLWSWHPFCNNGNALKIGGKGLSITEPLLEKYVGSNVKKILLTQEWE